MNAAKNFWQEAETKAALERVSSKGWGKGVGSGGLSVGMVGEVDIGVAVGEDEVGVGVDREEVDFDCCLGAIMSRWWWRW